jgi:excisionase family DNA binding protein
LFAGRIGSVQPVQTNKTFSKGGDSLMADRLLTVNESLDRLNIGRTAFYQLVKAGQLRTVTLGRRRLVAESEIDRFIRDASTSQPAPAA